MEKSKGNPSPGARSLYQVANNRDAYRYASAVAAAQLLRHFLRIAGVSCQKRTGVAGWASEGRRLEAVTKGVRQRAFFPTGFYQSY